MDNETPSDAALAEIIANMKKAIATPEEIKAAFMPATETVTSNTTVTWGDPFGEQNVNENAADEAAAELVPSFLNGDDFIGNDDVPAAIPTEQAEPAVPEEPIHVNLDVLYGSDHENVGMAFKMENDTLRVILPEGQKVKGPNEVNLVAFWTNPDLTMCKADQIVVIEYSPVEQRTCKYFSPYESQIEQFGAELSDYYDFDRAHRTRSVCSNPEIIKATGLPNPQCIHEEIQTQCHVYIRGEWETTTSQRVTTNSDEVYTLRVEKTRQGYGFPAYRIVQTSWTVGEDGELLMDKVSVLDTISHSEWGADTDTMVENTLANRITALDPASVAVEEIEIAEEEETKKEYMAYVLDA